MAGNRKGPHQHKPGIYTDPRYLRSIRALKKWDRDCHICGYPIDMQLRYPHPLSWSADHIIPKSHLPPGDPRLWHVTSLQASHLRCNQSRGNNTTTTEPPPLDW